MVARDKRFIGAPAASAGIDVVDLDRVRRDVARWGSLLATRIGVPAWSRDERDVATALAVKEAAVKAIGGRWDGFAWPNIALGEVRAIDADDELAGALRGVLGAIEVLGCAVGVPPDASRFVLGEEVGSVDVQARWATDSAVVIAVVALARRPSVARV